MWDSKEGSSDFCQNSSGSQGLPGHFGAMSRISDKEKKSAWRGHLWANASCHRDLTVELWAPVPRRQMLKSICLLGLRQHWHHVDIQEWITAVVAKHELHKINFSIQKRVGGNRFLSSEQGIVHSDRKQQESQNNLKSFIFYVSQRFLLVRSDMTIGNMSWAVGAQNKI